MTEPELYGRIRELEEENDKLRAVVAAADKYDNGGSYPALRLALNKWRKAEKARQLESAGRAEGE